MALAQAKYSCSTCMKSYSRHEHLQRHLKAHGPVRPFPCSVCNKSFGRRDVLKRHQSTCTARIEPEEQKPSGTEIEHGFGRRRACLRCAKMKRGCSSKWPCQNCSLSKVDCVFPIDLDHTAHVIDTLIDQPTSSRVATLPGDDDNAIENHSSGKYDEDNNLINIQESNLKRRKTKTLDYYSQNHQSSQATVDRQQSLTIWSPFSLNSFDNEPTGNLIFLFEFTKDLGFRHSFESEGVMWKLQDTYWDQFTPALWSTNHQFASGIQSGNQLQLNTPGALNRLSSAYLNSNPGNFDVDIIPVPSDGVANLQSPQLPCLNEDQRELPLPSNDLKTIFEYNSALVKLSTGLGFYRGDKLGVKTSEIVAAIRNISSFDNPGMDIPSDWSPIKEVMCTNFFSPSKLKVFLETYWSIWSPNWPVIHKPTFDPLKASSTLVAALAMIGACHSNNAEDRMNAQIWFESVEEMVFRDQYALELLANAPIHSNIRSEHRRRLQAVQAAYAVCVYQNWDGNESSKRRMRHDRFKRIVEMSRNLHISRAQHPNFCSMDLDTFEWDQFCETEELIRTLVWVFMLDSALFMFYKIPPMLSLQELTMDLVSPESCFQAQSSFECFEAIRRWIARSHRKEPMQVYGFIKIFCGSELDLDTQMTFAYHGFINLWILTGAFHAMISKLQNMQATKSRCETLRTGLLNWKAVWNRYTFNRLDRSLDVDIIPGDESRVPLSHAMWMRPGFWRHASEYWLLACLLLERLESLQKEAKAIEQRVSLVDDENAGPTSPAEYDEEMSRLNELICDFHALRFQQ